MPIYSTIHTEYTKQEAVGMNEGYWVIRTYESGLVGEKIKFWVPGSRPGKKMSRRHRSDIRKAAQNEESAVRAMARLLNANFREGDWLLGLDYSEEGILRLDAEVYGRCGHRTLLTAPQKMDAIREAAGHQLVNCIRRVKRELEREGVELKYVFVTSDTDGKTGEAVRVHHHLVINREARDAFVRKWQDKGLGGVAWSPLEKQEDYIEIAKYLLAQVRKVDGENQYTSSRNLIRPRPKDRVAASSSEVRVPKGCRLLHRQEYKPGKAQYIRYRIERERGPTDGAA